MANDTYGVDYNKFGLGTDSLANMYSRNTLTNNVKMTPEMVNEAMAQQAGIGKGLAGTYAAKATPFSTNPQTSGTNWMGKGGYLDTGASVVGALGGLANAYVGYKSLQQAEDEFDFNKALSTTNLANQAQLINEQRMNSGDVGLALAGSTLTEGQRIDARDKITAGNVSGKI